MTDNPENPGKPADADRIAKVIARAGLASRREAERMIREGRVTVNGQKIDSPALDVLPTDLIVVDGRKLDEKQDTRLWLYYKPVGLVTSDSDEKGRQTVFDALPRDLPRVMSIGRLDLTSEGLLLLTNDGELKRRLELPSTGWLRRYRVRVNGNPSDLTFAPLRRGATIDGEDFAPMEIRLDSQQGANAWLTVGIREGRNREIRRAMTHVGLQVNRLIRVGYGPFKLAGLEKNQVSEVRRKVLRDQLGGLLTGEVEEKDREMRPRGAAGDRPLRGRPDDRSGDRPEGRTFRSAGPDRPRREDGTGPRGPRGKPEGRGGHAAFADRAARGPDDKSAGDRPSRGGSPGTKDGRPRGPRTEGDQGDRPRRSFAGKPGKGRFSQDGKPWDRKPADRTPKNAMSGDDRAGHGTGEEGRDRPRRGFAAKPAEGQGARRSFAKSGPRPQGSKPGAKGGRPLGGSKPFKGKPGGGGRPSGKPRKP